MSGSYRLFVIARVAAAVRRLITAATADARAGREVSGAANAAPCKRHACVASNSRRWSVRTLGWSMGMRV